MNSTDLKHLWPSFSGLALLLVGAPAIAATTWNYDLVGSCDPSSSGGVYVAECAPKTNPVLDLTMSGWSTGAGTISSPSAGTTFAAAKIYDWGSWGLGVVAGNESQSAAGPHAADNRYGTDALMLSFTSAVTLESVKIGWNGTDNAGSYDSNESSDISVLAYRPSNPVAPAPVMAGQSISQLLGSGWELVGNYGQVGKLTNNTANIVGTGGTSSSWWLISAYNSSYGSAASSSGYAVTEGNDYFKLLSVAGSTSPGGQTPEPGSMALAGLGIAGLIALRRRQKTV